MSFRVVIRYLIKYLANVFLYQITLRCSVDYIAERYFEHVSHDKRKFAYGFASERNFRDLSERYVVYETLDIRYRIFVFQYMIDKFADFLFFDLVESFIFVEICKTEVEHIIVERSRPRRVFGTVVYRVAEDLVRYRKNYIRRACMFA